MTDAPDPGPDANERLAALAALFAPDGPADFDDSDGPVHWPSLTAEEAPAAWEALRRWVTRFRLRYPSQSRLPECWWRHNEFVEALAALRDYERACFAPTAPATAAVEWQRAFRDIEVRLETWVRRLRCTHDATAHDAPTPPDDTPPAGWAEWVRADAERRPHADQPPDE